MNQGLTKGTATDSTKPESVTVNGMNARQYEDQGDQKRDNFKYTCLTTVIEAPDKFYTILACAPATKYEENKAAFKQIRDSFRTVGASGS
jgi:hypothetical protein